MARYPNIRTGQDVSVTHRCRSRHRRRYNAGTRRVRKRDQTVPLTYRDQRHTSVAPRCGSPSRPPVRGSVPGAGPDVVRPGRCARWWREPGRCPSAMLAIVLRRTLPERVSGSAATTSPSRMAAPICSRTICTSSAHTRPSPTPVHPARQSFTTCLSSALNKWGSSGMNVGDRAVWPLVASL